MNTTDNNNPELTNPEIKLSPLEEDKLEEISKIANEYNQAVAVLGDLNIRLENQQTYCMNLFLKLNNIQEEFNQKLIKKYGPFKVNENGIFEKVL